MRLQSIDPASLPAAFVLLLTPLCLPQFVAAEDERVARQRQLDQACEAARQKALVPVRREMVEECVAKEERDREDCETAYSNYGERVGTRPPLFYDLPECVAASDFQKSTRQAR